MVAFHAGGHLGHLLGRDVLREFFAPQIALQDEVGPVGDGLAAVLPPQKVTAQRATPQLVDRTHLVQDLITLFFEGEGGGIHTLVISLQI